MFCILEKGVNTVTPASEIGLILPCLATILIESQSKTISGRMGNTYFQNTGLNAMAAAETGFHCELASRKATSDDPLYKLCCEASRKPIFSPPAIPAHRFLMESMNACGYLQQDSVNKSEATVDAKFKFW